MLTGCREAVQEVHREPEPGDEDVGAAGERDDVPGGPGEGHPRHLGQRDQGSDRTESRNVLPTFLTQMYFGINQFSDIVINIRRTTRKITGSW